MKKIGLVGGISWPSTMDYYKFINEGVNSKLGGLHFAECMIYSINFGDIQSAGWENAFDLLLNACQSLKGSGAESIVLCANTAHLYADKLQEEINLPIINIIDETAKAITEKGFRKVGLLGTKYTMEMPFYKQRLEKFGLQVLVPAEQETRDYMQYVIKEELGKGLINPASRTAFISIAEGLLDRGAECIILGCTEIPMLITQDDFSSPVFDTTKIHARAIVEYMTSSITVPNHLF